MGEDRPSPLSHSALFFFSSFFPAVCFLLGYFFPPCVIFCPSSFFISPPATEVVAGAPIFPASAKVDPTKVSPIRTANSAARIVFILRSPPSLHISPAFPYFTIQRQFAHEKWMKAR